jgi:hypothetical protein
MNPALIICPSEQQKNLRMRKEVKNWDAPLTGCVVVFVFEEISLMVFSINEGSFNF